MNVKTYQSECPNCGYKMGEPEPEPADFKRAFGSYVFNYATYCEACRYKFNVCFELGFKVESVDLHADPWEAKGS